MRFHERASDEHAEADGGQEQHPLRHDESHGEEEVGCWKEGGGQDKNGQPGHRRVAAA